jgi:uncharacterized protein (TIGR00369 family)
LPRNQTIPAAQRIIDELCQDCLGLPGLLDLDNGLLHCIQHCSHISGGIKLIEPNPEHLTAVINAINNGPFFKHMSIKVTEIGVGYSVVVMRIGRKHMNPFGGLHGGVYASAIDTAAYWSAYCDLPEKKGLVSIDLKVDFLAPVLHEKVIINGQRIKTGKTIYLAEARMCDRSGKVLAHGTSKLMVTSDKQSIKDVVDYLGSSKLPQKFLNS